MTRLIRAEIYKLSKRSMTYILLLILIGLFALIMLITQAIAIGSTTTTTVVNGIPTTQSVPVLAANVQFLQGAITSSIAMLGGKVAQKCLPQN